MTTKEVVDILHPKLRRFTITQRWVEYSSIRIKRGIFERGGFEITIEDDELTALTNSASFSCKVENIESISFYENDSHFIGETLNVDFILKDGSSFSVDNIILGEKSE